MPWSAQKSSFSRLSTGWLQGAGRLEVEDEVRLRRELRVAAAHGRRDLRHPREVAPVLGDHAQRLGRVLHHRAEALEQGDVRIEVARMRVGHDEVDLREGVAEPRRHLAVGEDRRPVLAGLHVVDAGDRRAVAEVRVEAAERHGVLSGAVVDLDDRRRRAPRLLHELARHLDEVRLDDLGTRRAQQLKRLGVMHALADGAHDLQRGLVDRGFVVVREIRDASAHGSALCRAAGPEPPPRRHPA